MLKSLNRVSATCAAAAFIVTGLWASAASAVTFTTSSVTVTDASFSPTLSFSSVGLNNNIVLGTPLTIHNFIIGTINGTSTSDLTGTVNAAFIFTNPTAANTNDTGVITGTLASSHLHDIGITWADPILLTFLDGTTLQINLANLTDACSGNCDVHETFGIDATFTLMNGPVTVTPLPAALPLFATGIAGLGLLRLRRKRKAAQKA